MPILFLVFSSVLLALSALVVWFTFLTKQGQSEAMQAYELAAKLGLAAAAI